MKEIGPEGRDTSKADGDDGADDRARGGSIEVSAEKGAADFDLHPVTRTANDARNTAKRI